MSEEKAETTEVIEDWLGREATLGNFMRIAKFRFIPDTNDIVCSAQVRDGTTVWGGGESHTVRNKRPLEAAKVLALRLQRKGIEPCDKPQT